MITKVKKIQREKATVYRYEVFDSPRCQKKEPTHIVHTDRQMYRGDLSERGYVVLSNGKFEDDLWKHFILPIAGKSEKLQVGEVFHTIVITEEMEIEIDPYRIIAEKYGLIEVQPGRYQDGHSNSYILTPLGFEIKA